MGELYKLNSQVCMRFLNKIGLSNIDKKYTEDFLKPLENRYLEYKSKYSGEMEGDDEVGRGGDMESPLLE